MGIKKWARQLVLGNIDKGYRMAQGFMCVSLTWHRTLFFNSTYIGEVHFMSRNVVCISLIFPASCTIKKPWHFLKTQYLPAVKYNATVKTTAISLLINCTMNKTCTSSSACGMVEQLLILCSRWTSPCPQCLVLGLISLQGVDVRATECPAWTYGSFQEGWGWGKHQTQSG